MASVTRENLGVLHDKLSITITKDDYLKNFETSLKKHAQTANIPGFRKGMVPTGLVKKMYGAGVFHDTVLKAAEQELTKYMTDEKLKVFGQALPYEVEKNQPNLDMNNPSDYKFDFEIGLQPEVVADVTKHTVIKYVIEVEDKMVEEELDRLQRRFGNMTSPETVSNEEDMLNISLVESDENGIEVENGAKVDDSVLLKYFKADFRSRLIAGKVDDSIILQLNQAFEGNELQHVCKDLNLDETNTEHTNKFFKLTITKIGFVEKAELNETLFEQAFPGAEIKTEADFREYLKKDISKAFDKYTRNSTDDQIYHALIDNVNVDVPEQFLRRWLKATSENEKNEEETNKEFEGFKSSLKWSVISNKLIEENKITVEQNDFKELARQQLFSYMGMGINVDEQPWVEDYINRMMKDKKFVEDSYLRIQNDKLFGVLESQVNKKEQSIKFDEFSKMQEEHNKHHH